VTFRRDPVNGHSTFAVFDSPQAACARFSLTVPLKVEWIGAHRERGSLYHRCPEE
jgi:hypothetical protein